MKTVVVCVLTWALVLHMISSFIRTGRGVDSAGWFLARLLLCELPIVITIGLLL